MTTPAVFSVFPPQAFPVHVSPDPGVVSQQLRPPAASAAASPSPPDAFSWLQPQLGPPQLPLPAHAAAEAAVLSGADVPRRPQLRRASWQPRQLERRLELQRLRSGH